MAQKCPKVHSNIAIVFLCSTIIFPLKEQKKPLADIL